jgi:hypothetical protein
MKYMVYRPRNGQFEVMSRRKRFYSADWLEKEWTTVPSRLVRRRQTAYYAQQDADYLMWRMKSTYEEAYNRVDQDEID